MRERCGLWRGEGLGKQSGIKGERVVSGTTGGK